MCVGFLLLPVPAWASDGLSGMLHEETAELWDVLSEDTRNLLDQIGVSESDGDTVADLTPERVIDLLLALARDSGSDAVRTGAAVLGVLLLLVMTQCIAPDSGESASRTASAIGVVLCAVLLLKPLTALMEAVTDTLSAACAFQLSFVPVFASVLTVGGQTVSAGKYTVLMVSAGEIGSVVLRTVILPLLKMSAALSVTGAAAPTIRLNGIGAFIQKGLTWLLGLLMTVFLAVLSLQGIVGAAADSVADKAAQFVLSSAVPVVGGALSQAYASARGYLQVLKSGVGAFGILASCMMLLPQTVKLLVWRIVLTLCAEAGELLDQKQLADLLRRFSGLLGVLLGVLLCGGLMTVVSIGVMLTVRGV